MTPTSSADPAGRTLASGMQAHRRVRQRIPALLRRSSPWNLLAAPVIYSMIVPFVLLDAWTTLYQWSCFPVYGIAVLRRRPFFVIDRHRLTYLNAIEKANCAYCSYATGVIAYVREITARTEQYWCPIKHARSVRGGHRRYAQFADYGDAAGFRRRVTAARRARRFRLAADSRSRSDRRALRRNVSPSAVRGPYHAI
jgi:hypothetical protein